jgi:ABC-type Fe3+-hydroxamate transport system substrate-binding protein
MKTLVPAIIYEDHTVFLAMSQAEALEILGSIVGKEQAQQVLDQWIERLHALVLKK